MFITKTDLKNRKINYPTVVESNQIPIFKFKIYDLRLFMKNNSYRSHLGILYPSCLANSVFQRFSWNMVLKSPLVVGSLRNISVDFCSLWKTIASGV